MKHLPYSPISNYRSVYSDSELYHHHHLHAFSSSSILTNLQISHSPSSHMAILILLAQCVAMFLASFLAGSHPLMFKSALSGAFLGCSHVSFTHTGPSTRQAAQDHIRSWDGTPRGRCSHHHHPRVSEIYRTCEVDIDSRRGVSTLYGALPGDALREQAVEAIGWSLLAGFALMLL